MSKKHEKRDPQLATLEPVLEGRKPSSAPRLLVAVLCLTIAVLVVLLLKPAKLDVYKAVDELEFADSALAACVEDTAEAHGWTDVGHVVTLRCNHPSGDPVRSLGGIEQLVSLSDVNLAFNAIADATPLAELPRLAIVDLSHNRLQDLPVFRSSNVLERLELNYNQFESLDWMLTQHLLVLHSLSIAHNHIDSLAALESLPQLRELNVRNNRIVDVRPVFNHVGLELLDMGSNMISSVQGIGALEGLRRVFVDRNQLTDLDGLSELAWLEELDLSNNPLVNTSALGALQRLQRLNLSHTGAHNLEGVLTLGDLEVLRLRGNDELGCDQIAIAIAEFGETTVIYDGDCPQVP